MAKQKLFFEMIIFLLGISLWIFGWHTTLIEEDHSFIIHYNKDAGISFDFYPQAISYAISGLIIRFGLIIDALIIVLLVNKKFIKTFLSFVLLVFISGLSMMKFHIIYHFLPEDLELPQMVLLFFGEFIFSFIQMQIIIFVFKLIKDNLKPSIKSEDKKLFGFLSEKRYYKAVDPNGYNFNFSTDLKLKIFLVLLIADGLFYFVGSALEFFLNVL